MCLFLESTKKYVKKKHCEYEEHKSYVNQAFYFLGETHITKKELFQHN